MKTFRIYVTVKWLCPALVLLPLTCLSCKKSDSEIGDRERLFLMIHTLRPLHSLLGKPAPGDWLDLHSEPGQTFEEYLNSQPVTPRGKRKIIYIQPIGIFTPTQDSIINLTADFTSLYFNLPVSVNTTLPPSIIPSGARRHHPEWGMEQILTTYVLDSILKPSLPDDAAIYLAFAASDLWPGEGWNFVFGQASLSERIGVWSIYRNGNPDKSPNDFSLCLLRTIKTAVHESGHMFSMRHCIRFKCCMCGSNHREESDRNPLWLCPECVAKVCWATGSDPVERYGKLAMFCEGKGLIPEEAFYRRSARALGNK